MEETARKSRNASKLLEMHPVFREKVLAVLAEMERAGLRPRIQEAWRSAHDQAAAFSAGTSKLKYGFHNVTGADGSREALAADIIDDDHEYEPPRPYTLHLAAAALRNGLYTGAFFDLSDAQVKALHKALTADDWNAPVALGWDPCHVQVLGLSVAEAQAGKRPEQPGMAQGAVTPAVQVAAKRRYRVTDLATGRTEDLERESALRPVGLLAVPWISQRGPGADLHSKDAGAACAVMLLAAYLKLTITPDDFYVRFSMPEDTHLSVSRLRNALGSLGLLTDLRTGMKLADLWECLRTGRPALVFLRYRALTQAGLTGAAFEGPHAALAVGMDAQSIYLHDPFYAEVARGEAHGYPLESFLMAWKETASDPELPQAACSAVVPVGALGGKLTRRVRVSTEGLNVRQSPVASSPQVGTLKAGDLAEVRREVSGWGEIGENRWIALRFVQAV